MGGADNEQADDGATSFVPGGKVAAAVVALVVVLLVLVVAVIWTTGVFDKDTSATDAQVVVALVTLFGSLVTASLTLAGVLLKHSIDQQTTRLARDAERSRQIEARDTENRLRLETSIKAVELLTTPEGKLAPRSRQAGALFVLGSPPLRQLDLARALVDELWPANAISSSAAVWVIDQALRCDDESLQDNAALTLLAHARRLPLPNGDLEWPACAAFTWPLEVVENARSTLLRALTVALASRPPDAWTKPTVNWFVLQYNVIRTAEGSNYIAAGATLVLDLLLDWYVRNDPDTILITNDGDLSVAELKATVASDAQQAVDDASEQMLTVILRLKQDWGPGDFEQPAPKVDTRPRA